MKQSTRKILLLVGVVPILMVMLPPAFSYAMGQSPQIFPNHTTRPAGNAEEGKKFYKKIGCWSCHGHSAQGGAAGPALGPAPSPFPAFSKYVRAPAGEMPPYTTKVLPDAKLADIYAFLESIPAPPDVDDIPLLNQAKP